MREPTPEDVLRRIERLECELRAWRRTAAMAVVLLGLLGLAGAQHATVPDELRARRFVLADGSGREVADLYSPSPGSASLFVSGPRGAISLAADGGGTYLHLRDKETTNEVVVDVDNDAPGVRIKRERSPRVALAAGREGPSIVLHDDQGQVRAVMGQATLTKPHGRGVEQRPLASMTLLDRNGRVIWKSP